MKYFTPRKFKWIFAILWSLFLRSALVTYVSKYVVQIRIFDLNLLERKKKKIVKWLWRWRRQRRSGFSAGGEEGGDYFLICFLLCSKSRFFTYSGQFCQIHENFYPLPRIIEPPPKLRHNRRNIRPPLPPIVYIFFKFFSHGCWCK